MKASRAIVFQRPKLRVLSFLQAVIRTENQPWALALNMSIEWSKSGYKVVIVVLTAPTARGKRLRQVCYSHHTYPKLLELVHSLRVTHGLTSFHAALQRNLLSLDFFLLWITRGRCLKICTRNPLCLMTWHSWTPQKVIAISLERYVVYVDKSWGSCILVKGKFDV